MSALISYNKTQKIVQIRQNRLFTNVCLTIKRSIVQKKSLYYFHINKIISNTLFLTRVLKKNMDFNILTNV